jgi:hypothetical protein
MSAEAASLATAVREAAVHTAAACAASAEAYVMRAVALRGSVRCVRQ